MVYVVCLLLLSKHTMTKTKLRRKGLIWLPLPGHNLSVREAVAGTMEECHYWLMSTYLFYIAKSKFFRELENIILKFV